MRVAPFFHAEPVLSHLFSVSFESVRYIENILIRSLQILYVSYKFFHLNNGKVSISIIPLFTAVVIIVVIIHFVAIIYNSIIFTTYLFDTVICFAC